MKSNNALTKGLPASKNKNVTKSTELAAVDKVTPALPAVKATASEPPLTGTYYFACYVHGIGMGGAITSQELTVTLPRDKVLEPEPSCMIFNVNVDVPFAGTFVKSISVTFVSNVSVPVLPFAKFIDSAACDVTATSVSA